MRRLSKLLMLIGAVAFMSSCGGDDDEDSSSSVQVNIGESVPRISGQWSGSFFQTNASGSEAITATIRQNRDAIVIETSKAEPPGQRFTGGIDANGDLTMTDASDGETWTTYFGPVTTNFVKIADFISRPDPLSSNSPPLVVIELRR